MYDQYDEPVLGSPRGADLLSDHHDGFSTLGDLLDTALAIAIFSHAVIGFRALDIEIFAEHA